MKDFIVEDVRDIRKKLEQEFDNDWKQLSQFFLEKQKIHTEKIYSGNPQKLPKRYAA